MICQDGHNSTTFIASLQTKVFYGIDAKEIEDYPDRQLLQEG